MKRIKRRYNLQVRLKKNYKRDIEDTISSGSSADLQMDFTDNSEDQSSKIECLFNSYGIDYSSVHVKHVFREL